MQARLDSVSAWLLPRGWVDLARQIALFCGAYWLYRVVRGLTDADPSAAFANAREIVDLERSLGLFFEPGLYGWAQDHRWLMDTASWLYVNSHFTVTTLALAFIYLRRNDSFYWIRNMFMVAMGLALVGYAAFPTAPPRFLPELGFGDPVAEVTGVTAPGGSADLLYNAYAAVPSMHVAFALMLGLPMAGLVRRAWARRLWLAYPALVSLVVVVTANHWWIDAFLGAGVAAVSAVAAVGLARVRPEAWEFRAATAA
jgi:hypothetical protein